MRTFSFAVVLLFGGVIVADDVLDLVKKLKSSDTDERRQAAAEIGKLKGEAKSAGPDIIAALRKETDKYVRKFLTQALGAIGADPKMAVPVLTLLLREPSKDIIEAALGSLGKMGADGVTPLVDFLSDTPRGDMKKKGGDKGGSVLKSDPDGAMRTRAASALGEIGPQAKAAVPVLVNTLKNTTARIEAATALGKIGPDAKEALKPLRDFMEDKNARRDKNFMQAVGTAVRQIESGGKGDMKGKKKKG